MLVVGSSYVCYWWSGLEDNDLDSVFLLDAKGRVFEKSKAAFLLCSLLFCLFVSVSGSFSRNGMYAI